MTLRHYEVYTPTMVSHYSYDEAPESWGCWGIYLAKNKRDAVIQAVKDPEFRPYVDEMRADKLPPFMDLTAQLALCEHGNCWVCPKACEQCELEDIVRVLGRGAA